MVPRRRSAARRDWPPNLYPCKNGFKYRHPATRKDHWMGTDRAKAFAAARKLNAMLIDGSDLVGKVTDTGETIGDALKLFRAEVVPTKGWAPKTAEWYAVFLNRIEQDLGEKPIAGFSVRDCATYIREVTDSARSRQTYRLILDWILGCAVEEGWIESNPALQTRKHAHERKRERLTPEAYAAIYAVAPAWLQNAMDLSLLTLQRREDVADAKFTDYRDGSLFVVPQKTENSTLVRLQLKDDDGAIAALVARCRADNVASPYLVHRVPERVKARDQRARDRVHHTQVLPAQLSRAFADARAAAGIEGDNPPTFHEIRSLGAAEKRRAGWSEAQVQALLGHADRGTTHGYLEGHELPWTEISIGA